MQNIIAKRLRASRQEAGLTQQQLSDRLGFKDRQTLAAIESGARKISADELLTAMKVLNRDLQYFTDPLRLDGEGSFSWRTSGQEVDLINEFESQAGRWPALYRYLTAENGVRTAPLRLNLTEKSSYEDAHLAAAWLADEWELGDIPSASLGEAVRVRLRALLLYVDAPEGISGAALRLPELSVIFINRNEAPGRRNFDLAHELFHLLTWETVPPAHAEDSDLLTPKKRGEQLANCFASALLMPEAVLRAWWQQAPQGDETRWASWMLETARKLRVSAVALQWRLVQLGLLEADAVDNHYRDSKQEPAEDKPRQFSLAFVEALKEGIEEGTVSVRRVSALVGMSIDGLADLFRAYSLEVPYDI